MYLSGRPCSSHSAPELGIVAAARDVEHPWLADVVVREAVLGPGERLDCGLLIDRRPEAAADDGDAVRGLRDAVAPAGDRSVRLEHGPRDRPAGDQIGPALAAGDRKGEADPMGAASEKPVGEAQVAVGLGEDEGKAHPDRREADRPGDVAPAPENDVRPAGLEHVACGADRAPGLPRRRGRLQRISPVKPAHPEEVDLVPGRRNQFGLGAVPGPEEADLGALSAKRVGDGDRRYDVPRRAAGRYHDSCHLLRAFSFSPHYGLLVASLRAPSHYRRRSRAVSQGPRPGTVSRVTRRPRRRNAAGRRTASRGAARHSGSGPPRRA